MWSVLAVFVVAGCGSDEAAPTRTNDKQAVRATLDAYVAAVDAQKSREACRYVSRRARTSNIVGINVKDGAGATPRERRLAAALVRQGPLGELCPDYVERRYGDSGIGIPRSHWAVEWIVVDEGGDLALARTEIGDFPLAKEHGRWRITRV